MSDDVPEIPLHVSRFLGERSTLTLATASPAGVPHAATFLFAHDDRALYFWTRPGTTTTNNIEANPVVSFTVDSYASSWTKIKGVQGRGESAELSGDELDRAVGLFQRKFAGLKDADPASVSFLRIVPYELHYIDTERAEQEEDDADQGFTIDFHRDLIFNVFQDLPVEQAADLAAHLETVKADEGEVIVRQGSPADRFFIIVDGEVEIVREDGGAERQIATLGAGHFFGEVAILRDTERTATVRALRTTTLLAMDRETFTGLVADSLATSRDLEWVIRQRHASVSTGSD